MASFSYAVIHLAFVKVQDDFRKRFNFAEDSGRPSIDSSDESLTLSSYLYRYSHQLDRDWMFLRMFTVSIHRWSDAGKLLQNSGRSEWVYLVVTIEAVAKELLERVLNKCCSNPSELLNLLERIANEGLIISWPKLDKFLIIFRGQVPAHIIWILTSFTTILSCQRFWAP